MLNYFMMIETNIELYMNKIEKLVQAFSNNLRHTYMTIETGNQHS